MIVTAKLASAFYFLFAYLSNMLAISFSSKDMQLAEKSHNFWGSCATEYLRRKSMIMSSFIQSMAMICIFMLVFESRTRAILPSIIEAPHLAHLVWTSIAVGGAMFLFFIGVNIWLTIERMKKEEGQFFDFKKTFFSLKFFVNLLETTAVGVIAISCVQYMSIELLLLFDPLAISSFVILVTISLIASLKTFSTNILSREGVFINMKNSLPAIICNFIFATFSLLFVILIPDSDVIYIREFALAFLLYTGFMINVFYSNMILPVNKNLFREIANNSTTIVRQITHDMQYKDSPSNEIMRNSIFMSVDKAHMILGNVCSRDIIGALPKSKRDSKTCLNTKDEYILNDFRCLEKNEKHKDFYRKDSEATETEPINQNNLNTKFGKNSASLLKDVEIFKDAKIGNDNINAKLRTPRNTRRKP